MVKGPEFLKKQDAWPAKAIKVNQTGYDKMKQSSRPTAFTRTENSSVSVGMAVTGYIDNFPLEWPSYSSSAVDFDDLFITVQGRGKRRAREAIPLPVYLSQ